MEKSKLLFQLNRLRENVRYRDELGSNCHWQIGEALNNIRSSILESSTTEERKSIEKLILPIQVLREGPYSVESSDALRLCDQLISLCQETERNPQTPSAPQGLQRIVPRTKTVFVIYGHDATNTLQLRNLLRERYQLEPIILSERPGSDRTLIEKFEEEATKASFAFALLTPDDLIEGTGQGYAQARPNVVFEVGWFYGRLGRKRVCILFKEGTRIHSDLDGILRIQFRESVQEKVVEIENELRAAGLFVRQV